MRATFNNTIVTITDTNGETLCWDSAGTIGFKGARKSTPFAATRAGESCGAEGAQDGDGRDRDPLRGAGAGRESAINGLVSKGLRVTALEDHSPVPHNGCRPASAV